MQKTFVWFHFYVFLLAFPGGAFFFSKNVELVIKVMSDVTFIYSRNILDNYRQESGNSVYIFI